MKNNKLKELKNLKLRTSTVGLRNKLGIIAIAFLLVFAAGVNATIRLKDPSGSTSGYSGDGGVITSNNGVDIKSWVPTNTNFQAAIWSLNGTSGSIDVPECNITLTSSIVPIKNITIRGQGRKTILYTNQDIDMIYFQGDVFPDDRGFHIDGVCFKADSGHASKSAICIDRSHQWKITNCWFEGVYNGVYLYPVLGDVDNGWIVGNHFYKFQNFAIGGEASCEENVISDNIIEGYDGIKGIYYSGRHSTISGNTIEEVWDTGIESNVGDGMYISGNTNTVTANTIRESGRYNMVVAGTNNIISSNIIADCHGNGRAVSIEGSGHIITANSIRDNDGQGILCISGNNFTISNNNILGGTQGIALGSTNDVTVSNNKILNSSIGGISGDGQRYIITHNHIINSTSEGIYVTCDNSTFSFNVVLNSGQEGIQPITGANNNTFIGNYLSGNTMGFHVYGDNNVFKDNDLRQQSTPFSLDAAADGTIILDNPGYDNNSLFPFYEQNTVPTISDNCTAYWYDADDDYMYQIVNSYGSVWYVNMTTTI